MPRFAPQPWRWIRHFRDLRGFNRLWTPGGSDPSSPRIIAPWLSDTVQLVTVLSPALRSTQAPDPAVATNFTVLAPHDVNWKLISIVFTLTTDVNAANRVVRLRVHDTGGATIWSGHGETVQVASESLLHIGSAIGAIPPNLTVNRPILTPPGLWIPRNFSIRSAVVGMQAGDQITGISLLVEEWPG